MSFSTKPGRFFLNEKFLEGETLHALQGEYEKAMGSGRGHMESQFWVNTPEGRSKCVRLWGEFEEYEADGMAKVISGISLDISPMKEKEHELERRDQQLRSLMRLAGTACLEVDMDRGLVALGHGHAELLGPGWHMAELPFDRWLELAHPDDRARLRKALLDCRQGAESLRVEYRLLPEGGQALWLELGAEAVAGQAGLFAGLHRDLRQQKQAEEARRATDLRYQKMLSILSDVVWEYDYPSGTFTSNRRMGRLLGFSCAEVLPKGELNPAMVHPADLPLLKTPFQTLNQGSFREIDLRVRRQGNSYIWVKAQERIEVDATGLQTKKYGVLRDINNEKTAKMLVLNKNVELEQQNHQLERLNMELQKAKEKAEQSDRFKSSFIANISHEIRTPVTAIRGFSELLYDAGMFPPEKRKEFLNVVKLSGDRLVSVIDDILEIAQIEAGAVELVENRTDALVMLRRLADNYSNAMVNPRRLPIEVVSLPPDGPKLLWADEAKLDRVLRALLDNAIKFTQDGRITLGVERSGPLTRFWVADTGEGIEPERQRHIFQEFIQEDGSITRRYGGIGTGLAICKGLLRHMGGKIGLRSRKGQGSTFEFSLPTEKEQVLEGAPLAPAEDPRLDGKRILVAEDEPVNHILLVELLKPTGATVVHVDNGEAAVRAVLEDPEGFDLVLMDIKMPVLNGLEATERIKRVAPDLPIVAQTAFAMVEDQFNARKAGCDDFIEKPLNRAKFFALIQRFLVRRPGPGS